MADYPSTATSALQALERAGTRVTMTRKNVSIDPVTDPEPVPDTTGQFTCVILPVKPGRDASLDERQAVNRQRKLIIAAKGAPFEVEPGTLASFESATWSALSVTRLSPDGVTAIVYTAIFEKC